MSDVSFISAAPAKDFNLERRAPEPSVGKPPTEQLRAEDTAPADLPHKTKVMTEMRSHFQVTYTFINPDTDQVVARWPVTPPLSNDAPGAQFKQTI